MKILVLIIILLNVACASNKKSYCDLVSSDIVPEANKKKDVIDKNLKRNLDSIKAQKPGK